MLVPKRVKHRREFRGKMRGEAKGGKEVKVSKKYKDAIDEFMGAQALKYSYLERNQENKY